MAQQMVNGSRYGGDITYTNRMSSRYAVVNPPFEGKHKKPQDPESLQKRKVHFMIRHNSKGRSSK